MMTCKEACNLGIKGLIVASLVSLPLSMAGRPKVAMGQTISDLTASIEKLEGTMQEKEQAVADAQASLAEVVRDAYKNEGITPNSEVEVFLQSESLDELIAGTQYVSSMNSKYINIIDSARKALTELEDARESLVELKEMRQAQMKSRERADSIHFCQWGEYYSDIQYYCATIGIAGCGLCAYTMAIDILTGSDYTPDTMLPVCGDWEGLVHYPDMTDGTPDGSTHAEWTKNYFDVDMAEIDNTIPSLRGALSDNESVIIALARGNSFKDKKGEWRYTNGHYVCIYRCDENGFYVHDSACTREEGAAVYYTDDEMGTMLATGTFIELSN